MAACDSAISELMKEPNSAGTMPSALPFFYPEMLASAIPWWALGSDVCVSPFLSEH